MAAIYGRTSAGHARGQGLTTSIAYAVLVAAAALVLYPFIVLFLGSLKTEPGFIANPLGIPAKPTLDNYVYAWQSAHIPQFTVNSVIVSVATVGLTLALASTAAFGLSRFRFRGGRSIYLAFVLLLTIPVQIYIIPLYVVVVRLRLADNFLGLILPYTAGSLPLAVFLFKTAFDGLPGELLDAARMDGCSNLAAYWRIVLPLSRPIIATVTVFTFVQAWNEFFLALIFIHNPALQTLPLGLQAFFVNQYQTQFPQLFATLLMSIGPIVVVYLGLQRQFVAGLTAGAVKG
ncbi:MAG: carbohydrate ABC transporter permease [Verrucomicrobia bacterium]|nr:carbohydrate ABC transporter permease [Verrucomicrobiota bacterium]